MKKCAQFTAIWNSGLYNYCAVLIGSSSSLLQLRKIFWDLLEHDYYFFLLYLTIEHWRKLPVSSQNILKLQMSSVSTAFFTSRATRWIKTLTSSPRQTCFASKAPCSLQCSCRGHSPNMFFCPSQPQETAVLSYHTAAQVVRIKKWSHLQCTKPSTALVPDFCQVVQKLKHYMFWCNKQPHTKKL